MSDQTASQLQLAAFAMLADIHSVTVEIHKRLAAPPGDVVIDEPYARAENMGNETIVRVRMTDRYWISAVFDNATETIIRAKLIDDATAESYPVQLTTSDS